jgi:hypothetical protein
MRRISSSFSTFGISLEHAPCQRIHDHRAPNRAGFFLNAGNPVFKVVQGTHARFTPALPPAKSHRQGRITLKIHDHGRIFIAR